MRAEIVSVGEELLLGRIVDTNAAYITERLTRLGIDVRYKSTAGDNEAELISVLRIAANRADVVTVTGGLGPTTDDLTRQAVSKLCHAPLQLDKESLQHIEGIFRRRHIDMPANNAIQAMFPEGAEIIPNPNGTAPGFCVMHRSAEIIALPGVPSEMKTMFAAWVIPHVEAKLGRKIVTEIRTLNVFGMSESLIDQKIGHLMEQDNPAVGTQVRGGIIYIRVTARAESEQGTSRLIASTEAEVREKLGDFVFGADDEGLEHAVATLLEKLGSSLAVAESCTGGLLSSRITDVPGISRYFAGGFVAYSNDFKTRELEIPERLLDEFGAVSPEAAIAMAENVKRLSKADIGLSVVGFAGPDGGAHEKEVGAVYMAISDAEGTESKEARIRRTRAEVKDRAAKSALNMLRMRLLRSAEETHK